MPVVFRHGFAVDQQELRLSFELFRQGFHMRELFDAAAAPGGPEVQDDQRGVKCRKSLAGGRVAADAADGHIGQSVACPEGFAAVVGLGKAGHIGA